jgi:hypothetical protein
MLSMASKGILSTILRSEKIPYLLTILFALLSWSLTHIVSRTIEAPTMEYTIKEKLSEKGIEVTYTVSNISRNKLFENINFHLILKSGSILNSPIISMQKPMDVKDVDKPTSGNNYINWTIPELHPGWEFKIWMRISKDGDHALHFNTDSNKPIRLIESSFETFLLRNEFRIIKYMILSWLILIVIYISINTKLKMQNDK